MAQTDEFEELRDDYASKAAARERRRLQKLWDKMPDVSNEITCRWLEPIADGKDADVEVTINGEPQEFSVPATYYTMGGIEHKRRLRDYQAVVEGWALWKWHTARGTPVTERDVYQTEPGYQPPKFVWLGAEPIEVKRGPGRPPKEAAAA